MEATATPMHTLVKDLSPVVRRALRSVEFHATDVEVVPSSLVSVQEYATTGARGFAILVNLVTGETKTLHGSWGGSGIGGPTAVDDCGDTFALPEHGVVIKGQTGYPRTFATVYVHPEQVRMFLPAATPTTLEEQHALYCHKAIKGGAYRRDELARREVSQETVDGLVGRGLLAVNAAGAVRITTAGKNAIDGRVR